MLALALDEGGRALARLIVGLCLAIVVALLLVVIVPLALLASAGPGLLASAPPQLLASARPGPATLNAVHQKPPAAVRDLPPPSGGAPVEVARRYLGVPYVFGGSDPAIGLDCSGLVQLVYRQLGVALPRTAQTQYAATLRLTRDELQPGDLVFFARTYADPHDWITHVGIYVGDGVQINAPTTGQVVSIQPVFSGYWGAHFAGAGRVLRG
jgi:cell wall-associated NlpC family hydrolase